MTYEDLFFSAFLVGFAFQLAKYIAGYFNDFLDTPKSERKKPWFIALAIFFAIMFIYLSIESSSRQLF